VVWGVRRSTMTPGHERQRFFDTTGRIQRGALCARAGPSWSFLRCSVETCARRRSLGLEGTGDRTQGYSSVPLVSSRVSRRPVVLTVEDWDPGCLPYARGGQVVATPLSTTRVSRCAKGA